MVKLRPYEPVPAAIQQKPRFPFVTRLLLELFTAGELPNVREIDLEPDYGYVGRIVYHSGAVVLFRGARLHLNSLGASEIALDKGYTKYFLRQLGYHTPQGRVFLFPDYFQRIEKQVFQGDFQTFIDEVGAAIEQEIGFPCYLKPISKGQGEGVNRCARREDLAEIVGEYQSADYQLFLVEKAVNWPDYRVVVYKDEVVACYRRVPLTVQGDGVSPIRALLQRKQAEWLQLGRARRFDIEDSRIIRRLQRDQMSLETILPVGQLYQLHDVSNLCAGGEVEDYTERLHPYWRAFCVRLVADMGLRFCGVDLACADVERAETDYSILELNAVPGLSNYAASGERQARIVRSLYQRIFNEGDQG